jgi:uncharacterized damage-inducible protein DinB
VKLTPYLVTLAAAAVLTCASASAQTHPSAPAGFRGEFIAQLADVESKIEALADAMPQEKYAWRPMEGVRSVSEVFMHITATNYFTPTFAGIKQPEGLPKDMEKTVTEKAAVKEALKKSFDYLRTAITGISDDSLENKAKFFGQETTLRGVWFDIALHLHEHLGQSIAYARMNSVVPPWTAAQDAAEKKNMKK